MESLQDTFGEDLQPETPEEMFEEGLEYFESDPPDFENALENFNAAAFSGHNTAMYYLGLCHQKGYGIEKNLNEAINNYKQAARKGNKRSCYVLGKLFWRRKEYQDSLFWFEKAAGRGTPEAAFNAGVIYWNGLTGEKDEKEAYCCFKEAANAGMSDAEYACGNCLFLGAGVNQNLEEAVSYYTKAASKGHMKAVYNLGNCYISGQGIEQDKEGGMKLIMDATKTVPEACDHVGNYYYHGIYFKKSVETALDYFRKGIHLEGKNSHFYLGIHYLNVEIQEKAFLELNKAAAKGHIKAQFLIGLYHFSKKENDLGKEYINKAAEQGYSRAIKYKKEHEF